ncbi:hypothetical protein MKQ68_05240 [Chitinophaga horti]|uniref:Uncharacterized protein n=1 Tax=Chitinophaga horti TaxID=2920382 RepID=A0ABY6J8L1_9BACT|nr:DUF6770 family protein [Chitinophaga horti]UYQ94494.1 hypothetical protein MKQ68_05240 [Chitinophaga horti]
MKKHSLLLLLMLCTCSLFAQLKIENVYSVKLRNSGVISEKGQVKGYFFFYQSDKIDKRTNEYTVQVVDENLNKVQDIKFQDGRDLTLLEAAYNGNTLAFLYKNSENKTLDMKIYSIEGKLKFTYTAPYDKKSEAWMKQVEELAQSDNGLNSSVFDVGQYGYVAVVPVIDGKERTFEVRCYNDKKKKHYTYRYDDGKSKFCVGEFIGATDSLAFFTVMKKSGTLSWNLKKSVVAINFVNSRRAFELTPDIGDYRITPTNVLPQTTPGKISLLGGYYESDENVIWDAPRGMAIVDLDPKGNVLNSVVCSYDTELSKFLPVGAKGKIKDIGFLFVHKALAMPDGGYTLIAEGFRKKVSAGKIALAAVAGGGNFTNLEITDLVMMRFDNGFGLKSVDVFDKKMNVVSPRGMDLVSPQIAAMAVKGMGGFDYEFTTGEEDNSTFNVCFSDYEKSSEYKGRTFNTVRFNGTKYSTDKIELKSKASEMVVLPAKAGHVMIYEYFKKTKSLELRIEKLG